MSGIMQALLSAGNDSTANFTVNPVGSGSSTGPGNTFSFLGYAAAGSTIAGTNTFAQFYPDAAMGTATPGTINGATILGVYSSYINPATTGTVYVVTVAGDWSALTNTINTLSIGGTSVSTGATKTVVYTATNNTTRFTFTLAAAITSVFSPAGGSKQVIIT